MLADPRSRALVDQFRSAVAAPAESRFDHAGHAALSRLRRQPASGVPRGNRAVLREHHARGPQRARSAQRQLHLSERAAGEALRHPERVRHAVPPCRARRGQLARRPSSSGKHSDRDVVRHPNVAGASRQVRARQLSRRASPAAAARRAGVEGQHGERHACRCASGCQSTAPTPTVRRATT